MRFHRITRESDSLFSESFKIYESSFPLHEQRPLVYQKEILPHPDYYFEVALRDDELVGIVCYWKTGAYIYVEHFAISPGLRGQSFGSNCLEALCRRYELVILEIDPPVDSVSIRRERFYVKLDFRKNDYPYKHPAYRKGYEPYPLVIMSYPRSIGQSEYADFNDYVRTTVMLNVEK